MSFRHTCITQFLYKSDSAQELNAIHELLSEYGKFQWHGVGLSPDACGYFHGIIRDLDSYETKALEQEIIDKLKAVGVDIKIVYE